MSAAVPPKRDRDSSDDDKEKQTSASLLHDNGEMPPRLLPLIGLGTHTLKGLECRSAVSNALAAGLRLIDTASVYGNEEEVGAAIASSGIPRSEIAVISKASPKDMRGGYLGIMEACTNSLRRLNLTYLDVYLLHWPGVAGERPDSSRHAALRQECWRAMTQLWREGRCRQVGVSNFLPRHLIELTNKADRAVVVAGEAVKGEVESDATHGEACEAPAPVYLNQIELHPLCRQADVAAYCRAHGILVQQYSPLAKGDPRLMNHPVLHSVAEEYDDYRRRNIESVLPVLDKADWCMLWGLTVGGYSSLVVRTTKAERAARLAALERLLSVSGRRQQLHQLPGVVATLLQRIDQHVRRPATALTTAGETGQVASCAAVATAGADGVDADTHTCWFSDSVR